MEESASAANESDLAESKKKQTTTSMDSTEGGIEEIKEFVKFGRTGRRNAVADVVSDPNLTLSTANLNDLMLKISCKETDVAESAASKSEQAKSSS